MKFAFPEFPVHCIFPVEVYSGFLNQRKNHRLAGIKKTIL